MDEHALRKRRFAVLVYLYVLAVLWGALVGSLVEPVRTETGTRLFERSWLVLALATQLGFMCFCTVDARLAGRPLLRLARIGVFFGWPIGVPIYLLWARGLRGVVTLLLHGVLLLLCLCGSGLLVAYLRVALDT
ncbi:MAG: hypothetical protein JW993_01855 [Sedimentisphaerales bacterium]|nr:hypothetical protein [Sedimentisphaerales bacterium]